jgi:Lrp/AsnC family leucine-responsive transcriptional regulator
VILGTTNFLAMELNHLDRKLLYELDQNSRLTYAELGRKLRSLPETIRYRMDSLVSRGIVSSYFTAIDSGKLGFIHFKLLLRLHEVGDRRIDELIDFLVSNNMALRISKYDGEFDLGCVIKVSGMDKLDELVREINSQFGQFISRRSISINVWAQYLPRTTLINKDRKGAFRVAYKSASSNYHLDNADKLILSEISKNSRITATALSSELRKSEVANPLSVDTVTQRIKRLEKDGIISGYGLSLNPDALSQVSFKVLLFLNALPDEKLQAIIRTCQLDNRVVHIIKTMGEWDLELDLEIGDFRECRNTVMELTRKFPGTIRDYIPLRYLSIEKFSFFRS